MHRSGTSLIARFIHHSGIDLGDQLLGSNRSNQYGHYEDISILEFHSSILEREFGHQMWAPKSPGLTTEDYKIALSLVEQRQYKPYWGWKDPRTSLFLHFWSNILPDASYLFIIRHPDLVVDSLSRRNKTRAYQFWRNQNFFHAWHLYNQKCFQFYLDNESNCIMVLLEEVLDSPENFVKGLTENLQFKFGLNRFKSLYDSSAIENKFNRHLFVPPFIRRRNIDLYNEISRYLNG